MDYTYLYKHSYQRIDEIQNLLPYDIFISSYVNSQRVQEPADNIQAGQKIWFATEEEGRDLYLCIRLISLIYYILNPHNIDVLKTLNSLTFLRSKTDAWKVWYPYVKGRQ